MSEIKRYHNENSQLHPESGKIVDGAIEKEVPYTNGMADNIGVPSSAEDFDIFLHSMNEEPSENIVSGEQYCTDGAGEREVNHRNDGRHGEDKQEDKPSEVRYRENGSGWLEIYYDHNVIHRESGPAAIEYDSRGEVLKEQWFHMGEEFTPSQEQLDAYRSKKHHTSTVNGGMEI